MLVYMYSRDRSLGQIERLRVRGEEYMKLHLNGPASCHFFPLRPINYVLSVDYYK